MGGGGSAKDLQRRIRAGRTGWGTPSATSCVHRPRTPHMAQSGTCNNAHHREVALSSPNRMPLIHRGLTVAHQWLCIAASRTEAGWQNHCRFRSRHRVRTWLTTTRNRPFATQTHPENPFAIRRFEIVRGRWAYARLDHQEEGVSLSCLPSSCAPSPPVMMVGRSRPSALSSLGECAVANALATQRDLHVRERGTASGSVIVHAFAIRSDHHRLELLTAPADAPIHPSPSPTSTHPVATAKDSGQPQPRTASPLNENAPSDSATTFTFQASPTSPP
jgi:hypothetical protein